MRVLQSLAQKPSRSLSASGFPRKLRTSSTASIIKRRISVSTAGIPPPGAENQSAPEENEDVTVQDPGLYSMIIPEEPYQWGVAHIMPLEVPSEIPRPPYVKQVLECLRLGKDPSYVGESYDADGDGKIRLGTEDEVNLRKAASLAKRVLNFAGTLVKVRMVFALKTSLIFLSVAWGYYSCD